MADRRQLDSGQVYDLLESIRDAAFDPQDHIAYQSERIEELEEQVSDLERERDKLVDEIESSTGEPARDEGRD